MSEGLKAFCNRIKAKGLQKLRWYCQMCQKQCRDENGMKCHMKSESHLRQMKVFAENPDHLLDQFSKDFEKTFLDVLSHKHGTKRVHVNKVYKEYIADKHHVHMNSTQWTTLTGFAKHLGKEGKVICDETEKGWFITYIDRDPAVIARQAAREQKEAAEIDDEERGDRMIQAQIAALKAKKEIEGGDGGEDEDDDEEEMTEEELNLAHSLIRSGEEPLKLSLNMTAATSKRKLNSSAFGGVGDSSGVSRAKDIESTSGKRSSDGISPDSTEDRSAAGVASLFDRSRGGAPHPEEPAVKKVAVVANTFLADKAKGKGAGSLKLKSQLNPAIIPVKPAAPAPSSGSRESVEAMGTSSNKASTLATNSSSTKLTTNSKPLTTMELLMKEEEKKKKALAAKEDVEGRKDHWLHENIVVKVMNKKLSGGKYYKQKALVVRVIDKYVGEVKLLEDGVVTKTTLRLDQDDLETVIPKIGHTLLVLNGRGRGHRGSLLKINEDNFNVDVKMLEGRQSGETFAGIPYEDIAKVYS